LSINAILSNLHPLKSPAVADYIVSFRLQKPLARQASIAYCLLFLFKF